MTKLSSLLLIISLCGCYGKKPVKTGLEGKPMPAIDLLATDNVSHFNTTAISTGKPTMIFSFEPWCPYCKAQTEAIISNMADLRNVTIYMVSSSRIPLVKNFYDHYKLSKYPSIKVGVDTLRTFRSYIHDSRIPLFAFYDEQNKLKQVVVGKTSLRTIKNILFQ